MRPLAEQTILVTGATDGHGRALAALGATVLIHGRDDARGRKTITDITARTGSTRLYRLRGDLASLDQVRDLADRVAAEHPQCFMPGHAVWRCPAGAYAPVAHTS
jgi:NAD(P)-dependent dehydrogenase (short-subunit alcohol dehydrogenase family)